jgi:hypothetical protein
MKKHLFVGAFVALFVLVGSGKTLHAQSVTVDVPFQFKAGNTDFPAGSYKIRALKQSPGTLSFRNANTGETTLVPFITRLSPRDPSKGAAVFDKQDNQSYLSEVYLPGLDGFHLQGAPGAHTHKVLNALTQ